MKRFLFAVAAVVLSACAATAEDTPVTGTTTVPGSPVIMGATPAMQYAPVQTQRRGLFARLRNRNTSTMSYSTPLTTAPATVAPMPMPGTTPAPMPTPMPGVKPAGGVMTTGMVVPATGDLPPGQYTTTDGMIVQIGGKQMASQTQPQTTRRGLFSRLRNR
jgi:hypothetical protein